MIPRWKHYASATWDQGPWSATLAQTYQASYTDQQTDLNNLPRTVGSLSLWDLRGTYSGFKNLKLTLGVRNLFDRDPPKSNQQSTFILGFDPSYYDPRGRFLYTSVTHTFKWRTNAGRGSAQLRGAPNLRSGRGASPRSVVRKPVLVGMQRDSGRGATPRTPSANA